MELGHCSRSCFERQRNLERASISQKGLLCDDPRYVHGFTCCSFLTGKLTGSFLFATCLGHFFHRYGGPARSRQRYSVSSMVITCAPFGLFQTPSTFAVEDSGPRTTPYSQYKKPILLPSLRHSRARLGVNLGTTRDEENLPAERHYPVNRRMIFLLLQSTILVSCKGYSITEIGKVACHQTVIPAKSVF